MRYLEVDLVDGERYWMMGVVYRVFSSGGGCLVMRSLSGLRGDLG